MSRPAYFFTWSAQSRAKGRQVTGGQGAWFHTADGQRWLDLGSLSYQASLGHGHETMVRAICQQAESLCLAAPWAEFDTKAQLAERLLAMAPPRFARGKVFFTLGGSEAVENAMKMARLYTGKPGFVARYRSYHGASLGALSLSGDYRRPPLEPLLAGVSRLIHDDAGELATVIEAEGSRIAAVVLEPIPGANGVHVPPPGFFAGVRELCDRHGALLVADEVLTGFGRTGRGFALEHEGVEPDLITCGKALTAGYAPLGAVIVSEKIADHFADNVLWAGLTNYAHPLGCAAGLAALDVYRDQQLFERVARLESSLQGPLGDLARRMPEVVAGVRGRGFLAAMDVNLSDDGWRRLGTELADRRLYVHASQKRGTVTVAPPYIIGEDELAEGLGQLGEALAGAGQEGS